MNEDNVRIAKYLHKQRSKKYSELNEQLEIVDNELEEFESEESVCQIKKDKEYGGKNSKMVGSKFFFVTNKV